jgi:hypothetical protein
MVLGMPNFPLDADFHALAQHELAKWKVPGLTIAVIHGPYTHSKVYDVQSACTTSSNTHRHTESLNSPTSP